MKLEKSQSVTLLTQVKTPVGSKDELLAVAIEVFAKNGFKAASLRDITNRLGVSVSSVYSYFKSKEALWLAIQEHSVGQLLAAWERALSPVSGAEERFTVLVMTHLNYYTSNFQESKICISHTDGLSTVGSAKTKALQRLVLDKYVQHLKELSDAGHIGAAQNVRIKAFSVLGVINEYLGWFKPNGAMPPEEIHQETLEFVRAGVLRRS